MKERAGRPIEDWVLAHSPAFVASLRTADLDLGRGRAMSLEELIDRKELSTALKNL